MKSVHFIHEIKLPEKDEFSQRFNYVSWLYSKSNDETLSRKKRKFYNKEYGEAKLALEQGCPISFLTEYQQA